MLLLCYKYTWKNIPTVVKLCNIGAKVRAVFLTCTMWVSALFVYCSFACIAKTFGYSHNFSELAVIGVLFFCGMFGISHHRFFVIKIIRKNDEQRVCIYMYARNHPRCSRKIVQCLFINSAKKPILRITWHTYKRVKKTTTYRKVVVITNARN